MATIPLFTTSYRPTATGAALCRQCGYIFVPRLAHHVVCKKCHTEQKQSRE